MAVEAKVNEAQEVKREYPYLGRNKNGTVVLFDEKECGMCVVSGPNYNVGNTSKTWCEENFTPLSPSESITLSNKA